MWHRLSGGYDNISVGGHTSNALVDFTGGISETIDLRRRRSSPGDLFDIMYAMMKKCSMLACDIQVICTDFTVLSDNLSDLFTFTQWFFGHLAELIAH